MRGEKIAIIGGGLSGLLTAYRLSQAGFSIRLFEKEKELGGELSSFKLSSKSKVEKFYHHLFTHNEEAIKLFYELNLSLNTYKSQVGLIKAGQTYPFSSGSDLFHLPFLSFASKARLGLLSFFLPKLDYHRFETLSARNLVIDLGGQELWDNFWEPLFYQKFGQYENYISGAWFWGRLKDRAESRRLGELLIYPDGGFQALIERLTQKLKEAKVRFNKAEVKEIATYGRKFKVRGEIFDKVVCAVPMPVFLKIAPLSEKEKSDFMINHLSVMTVVLETKAKVTDYYWLNVLDKDFPFGVVVEQTNLLPESDYPSCLIYLGRYLNENDPLFLQSDEKVKKAFVDGFIKMFPKAGKEIEKVRLFRDNNAQPIINIGYQTPAYRIESGVYFLNSTQIYPFDRGVEGTISNVEKLVNALNSN